MIFRDNYRIEGALYKEALDYARKSRSFTSNRHDFHAGGLDNKQKKMLEGKLGEKAVKLLFWDNGIAFEEDHAGELGEYDGSGDDLTEIVVYQYPGGPLASQVSFQVDVKENPLSEYFQYLYTDENGLRWSKMGYYYGCRNVWVCLDRPVDDTLGEEQPQAAAQVRGEDSPALHPAAEEVPAPRTIPLWLIPAALVILAAAVTALLVRRTRKGKGGAE